MASSLWSRVNVSLFVCLGSWEQLVEHAQSIILKHNHHLFAHLSAQPPFFTLDRVASAAEKTCPLPKPPRCFNDYYCKIHCLMHADVWGTFSLVLFRLYKYTANGVDTLPLSNPIICPADNAPRDRKGLVPDGHALQRWGGKTPGYVVSHLNTSSSFIHTPRHTLQAVNIFVLNLHQPLIHGKGVCVCVSKHRKHWAGLCIPDNKKDGRGESKAPFILVLGNLQTLNVES